MNIYEELGIQTIINANDSETVIGGSTISNDVVQKIVESVPYFVEIKELEYKISENIAKMTHNDACLVTNGAAAGVAIAVAGCITKDDTQLIESVPNLSNISKKEIITFKSQRNNYDNVISLSGGKVIEIESNINELNSNISEKTACLVYFAGKQYEANAIPLKKVVEIAKKNKIPIIVDAAANLPPVSNLWNYTENIGADLVVFSGGKTLKGPQSSGLILGKKELINYCRLNNNPNKSMGRAMKTSKESMIGLYYAIKRYIGLNHEEVKNIQENQIKLIKEELSLLNSNINFERIYPGIHGQDYPRLKIEFNNTKEAAFYYKKLKENKPSIHTKYSEDADSIIINPLHLTDNNVEEIILKLSSLINKNR